MIPGTINSTTDTENNNNWFFKLLFPHTLSNSWSRAGDFYAHWGTAGGRTYKEVRYYTGFDALNDYSHILSTYTAGSSIIVGSHATTAHELFHSMFIYDSNVECDGKHKGVANTCVNNGTLNEFLYAQQGVANDKANQYYIMGHGVNLLIDYIDRYFVFLKYHQ